MHFIDKQDNISRFGDLGNGVFNSLLKIAAVFRSGHHTGQIQRDHALAPQELRDFIGGDFLGQAFCDGGFAHAGFADEAGVVFGSPGQDLDHPFDFRGSADHRIQPAFLCLLRQIPTELIERRGFPAALSRRDFPEPFATGGRAHGFRNIPEQFVRAGAKCNNQAHGHAAVVPQHRHEDVLRPHIAMLHHRRLSQRHFHGGFGPGGEILGRQPAKFPAGFHFDDFFLIESRRDTSGPENRRGHAGPLPQQAENDMLCADVGVPQLLGSFYG